MITKQELERRIKDIERRCCCSDEILFYDGLADFPATGVDGKIYVDEATGLLYRWNGSSYELVGGGDPVEWGDITGVLADQTDLQNALDLKAPLASPTFTGTVVLPSTTSIGTITNTELSYVDGVTSAIQTQLDSKAPTASPTFTTQIVTPVIYGGIAADGDITIEGTSNATKTTSYVNLQPTGGSVGIGTSTPDNLLHSELADALTNTVSYPFRLSHITSGTATTSFGIGQEYELENASGTNRIAATEEITWSDATNATEDATWKLKLIRAGTLTDAVTVLSSGNLTGAAAIIATTGFVASSGISGYTTSFGRLSTPTADGIWLFQNAGQTDFNRLQFGGTTSSFPSIKRSGTGIVVRLADDSADAPITALTGSFTGSGNSYFTGNVGIGQTVPTALLHLKAGTATLSTSPLKFTSGTNLTAPEAGAVEFDGTNYFATTGTTRYTLAKTLTNTATLNFGIILTLTVATLTITVTGAADGDVVALGVPNGSMTAGLVFTAWVSATNTVSVQCYNSTVASIDPASGTFRATVIQY